jgi:hypothetical protein
MADEDQAPPPPIQDAAPAEQAPANDEPEPAAPVRLPELELELHLRGGEPPSDTRPMVEAKDVETKDN